jgi:hypothetical protein
MICGGAVAELENPIGCIATTANLIGAIVN